MDMQKMQNLVGEAVRDADLHPEEIPAIDLYLDQITSLTQGKLKESSEHYHDRILTKTMINNYSKDGLIAPTKGKKYSKEHILQMLLVYSMKNTLSIGEIKRILQHVYGLPEYSDALLEDVYLRFLEIKEMERDEIWDGVDCFVERSKLDVSDEADFLTLILGLASLSSYYKSIVQVLLEEHYSDRSAEREREENEAKLQRKLEKKAAKTKRKESEAAE
ncbi:MAG: DUF1836 domain-containing protein [Clostridia bacterium]|nr:DUF1836 domain-containing protein [Clostridia bacterium]